MINRISRIICAFALATAFGCGGAGGNGPTPSIRYSTDWIGTGSGPVGTSQRISVFDSQERLVRTLILNRDLPEITEATLNLNSAGQYRVFVELFSGLNLTGALTGILEQIVSVSGAAILDSAVGNDPTNVIVTPATHSFPVQQSRTYKATARDGSGLGVFVVPGSITWSALGGHVTINASGIALGQSAGTGSVRATHGTSGFQGSALYDVQPFNAITKKWTVMVFLNSANDLAQFSKLNMNQMEKVAGNADVRFVVQWKLSPAFWSGAPFDGTRRYLVQPDNTDSIASQLLQDMGSGVDMGNKDTLREFIDWTKTYYPADRYCLVIWNHGNGWRRGQEPPGRAVSYDDETGNAIQIWELSQALGNNVLDIVAWDASLMQMIEVAHEISDKAHYVAGSEESPPGEGYPYDLVFDDFRDNPDGATTTLARAFVDGMLAVPAYQTRKITQSIIDTSQLANLVTKIDDLADAMIANLGAITSVIPTIRSQAQSYSPNSTRVYRDLDHLCQLLVAQTTVPAVQNAAAAVRTAITQAVIYEGHNTNSPNSRGVSIEFGSASQFAGGSADYAQLRFALQSDWDAWLQIAP